MNASEIPRAKTSALVEPPVTAPSASCTRLAQSAWAKYSLSNAQITQSSPAAACAICTAITCRSSASCSAPFSNLGKGNPDAALDAAITRKATAPNVVTGLACTDEPISRITRLPSKSATTRPGTTITAPAPPKRRSPAVSTDKANSVLPAPGAPVTSLALPSWEMPSNSSSGFHCVVIRSRLARVETNGRYVPAYSIGRYP